MEKRPLKRLTYWKNKLGDSSRYPLPPHNCYEEHDCMKYLSGQISFHKICLADIQRCCRHSCGPRDPIAASRILHKEWTTRSAQTPNGRRIYQAQGSNGPGILPSPIARVHVSCVRTYSCTPGPFVGDQKCPRISPETLLSEP